MKRTIALLICMSLTLSTLAGCSVNLSSPAAEVTSQLESVDGEESPLNEAKVAVEEEIAEDSTIEAIGENILSDEDIAITSKTITFYHGEAVETMDYDLYFIDGEEDIPYVDMDTAKTLLEFVYSEVYSTYPAMDIDVELYDGYNEEDNSEEHSIVWYRDGKIMYFDFYNDAIYFDEYGTFFGPTGVSYLDMMATYDNIFHTEDGNDSLYLSKESTTYHKKGYSIVFDLANHNIPSYMKNGQGYIPMQTFSDIFLAPTGSYILYNGQAAFICIDGDISDEIIEIYEDIPSKVRSAALREFTYNELCLALVANYGLKEKHNITDNFEEFFERTGLAESLQSENEKEYVSALYSLQTAYFADFHSGLIRLSPFINDKSFSIDNLTTGYKTYLRSEAQFKSARENMLGETIPGYIEIGNTAYITFDSFTEIDEEKDYYETKPTFEDVNDINDLNLFELIIYSHEQIMREDSPIENVVVDLSCNPGGDLSGATYLAAWMIGSCSINLYDTMTQEQTASVYIADVNLDHEFDENDTLASKNVYCLISRSSFSCGNLIPALCRDSGAVTLIGKQSGGGACVVQPLSLADGTVIQISGRGQINIEKNGAYYDVDEGIIPDIPLTKIESFYDREELTKYINELK